MEIYLKVVSGPRINDVFKVSSGVTLGRSKADVNLKDSKTSSIHGSISVSNNDYVFVDNNSTNGTFLGGALVDRVVLKPGVTFKIGNTELEVVTEVSLKKNVGPHLSEWRELFHFEINKLQTIQNPQSLVVFPKVVRLSFSTGIEKGTSYFLGYGPRIVGGGPKSDLVVSGETEDLLRFSSSENKVFIENLIDNSLLELNEKTLVRFSDHTIEVEFVTNIDT